MDQTRPVVSQDDDDADDMIGSSEHAADVPVAEPSGLGEDEATVDVPDEEAADVTSAPETEIREQEAAATVDAAPFERALGEIDPTEEPAAEVEEPAAEVEEPAAEVEEPAAEVEEPAAEADAAATEETDDETAALLAWQPGEWFVVHTYAGYENKVKANLETRISSMNMEDLIYEVVIPMEDVVEMKGGKKQVVQRKVFPGYLLVRMDLDDDSWYVVRNTPGVTGFVGSSNKPIPLSEAEVDRILQRGETAEEERPRPRPEWQVNDPVRVTTGPFANFQGVVSEIDLDRSKLKVLVNIFGRETPVELGFDQVSKV